MIIVLLWAMLAVPCALALWAARRAHRYRWRV
jgi:hypothetical protein